MENNKIILFDSEEAAKPFQMQGWISSRGLFFGKEEHARYDGCTHKKCGCGNVMEKGWLNCAECRHNNLVKKYESYPVIEVKDANFFYSLANGQYFSDVDEIYEYCEENEVYPSELMIVDCDPNYMNTFNSSYWEDIFPEDSDDNILSQEIVDAMKALNKVIKEQPPLSYSPANRKVLISF